jgi:hypothetical protein
MDCRRRLDERKTPLFMLKPIVFPDQNKMCMWDSIWVQVKKLYLFGY